MKLFQKKQTHSQSFPTNSYFKKSQITFHNPLVPQVMGQDLSTAINPPPLTLTHCFVDGNIDLSRYYIYKRRRAEQDKAFVVYRMNAKKKSESMTFPPLQKSRGIQDRSNVISCWSEIMMDH